MEKAAMLRDSTKRFLIKNDAVSRTASKGLQQVAMLKLTPLCLAPFHV